MRVYHYTTEESFKEMIKSNKFIPSSFITSDDSQYGPGWYFTDLSPATNIITLLYNLWKIKDGGGIRAIYYAYKAKKYLEYEIDSAYLEYCRPNVYRLKKNTISNEFITIGQNFYDGNPNNIVIKYIRNGDR